MSGQWFFRRYRFRPLHPVEMWGAWRYHRFIYGGRRHQQAIQLALRERRAGVR